jgi:glycosyltransferase involved in cell wall biosynthesis
VTRTGTASPRLKVVLLYWADPWHAAVSGGIDSYIRDFLKYAPPEVAIELIGATADPRARPVGRWSELRSGERTVRFFPLFAARHLSRAWIPLSLRYALCFALRRVQPQGDVVIAHRPEALLFAPRKRAVILVHHIGPPDIPAGRSDFRWTRARRIHRWVESFAVRRATRIHTVTERARDYYRTTYPAKAHNVRFFPTFFDPAVFHAPTSQVREQARRLLRSELGLPADAAVAMSVGRLDYQKDYPLSIAAFELLRERHANLFLLIIGGGILHPELQRLIAAAGMQQRILLLGERSATQIAAAHHGADLFVLTSAYEGMSIALLEAQACGLPVVVPIVGEARRTVNAKVGHIVQRTPSAIADAVSRCVRECAAFDRNDAVLAAAPYSAINVVPAICRDLLDLA